MTDGSQAVTYPPDLTKPVHNLASRLTKVGPHADKSA
jgi:hypothetical protein